VLDKVKDIGVDLAGSDPHDAGGVGNVSQAEACATAG
jgi:hypothetical protein